MKWIKLGKIFDPMDHILPNNCREFAQSPQALVYDSFVRIYFSTRMKDETDKFLSHVAFVDFDKTLQNIISISQHTILPLGRLGCYDEHGIFPFNVMRVDRETIFGYISGWSRRKSVSIETSIGLAISTDNGFTFNRIGDGPILTASLSESFLIGDPFVIKDGDIYHMWYIYGTKWIEPVHQADSSERVYKIGHACSADGIVWEKEGRQIIADTLDENECQALPTVLKYRGMYHMFFCYRAAIDFRKNKTKSYRIGYAYSMNCATWTRDDTLAGIDPSCSGWDSEMMCYPHIFLCENKMYMLYNGNEFGRSGFGAALLES